MAVSTFCKDTLILILGLLLSASVSAFAGLAPNEITVYKGTTPVLDGVLSPGEYDDASTFSGMKDWFPVFAKTTDDSDLSNELPRRKHRGI